MEVIKTMLNEINCLLTVSLLLLTKQNIVLQSNNLSYIFFLLSFSFLINNLHMWRKSLILWSMWWSFVFIFRKFSILYKQVELKQLEYTYFQIGIGLNNNVHNVFWFWWIWLGCFIFVSCLYKIGCNIC